MCNQNELLLLLLLLKDGCNSGCNCGCDKGTYGNNCGCNLLWLLFLMQMFNCCGDTLGCGVGR